MTAVALTADETLEVQAHADIAEPATRGRTVGHPATVAAVEARIPLVANARSVGPTLGWTATPYTRDDAGEVEIEQEAAYRMLDVPGATLSVDTAGVLLASVGERGPNRRFSLRFRFDRFGAGR